MEKEMLEKLIESARQGDIKAFSKVYEATFNSISSMLDGDSAGIECAYERMIATIGSTGEYDDIDEWLVACVDYSREQELEAGRRASKSAIYKKILKSEDAQIRFRTGGARRFIAGLTSNQKKVLAGVLAVIVVIGMVAVLVNKTEAPPPSYKVEKTTLPGEKPVEDKEDYSAMQGLCVYSPDGEYIYYSSNGCVRKMDRAGENDVVVAYGNAYSMIIHDKKLYFIAKGKINCVNTEDDQLISQVDTKGNLLCYTDRFFAVNTKSGIVYALNDDLLVEKAITVKSTHLKYKDGYIYYYQEGDNNLVRQKLTLPMGKAQIIAKGDKTDGMRLGYQISAGKAIIPTFDSDRNGDLVIVNLKNNKSKLLRLDHYFEDFALVGNRIIFSSYRFGTYICDEDGKNSRKLDDACLYFVNASGDYYAFNNLADKTTVLYSSKTGKIEHIIKADADSMEILGDFIIINCDGKMSKLKLSEQKKEA